MSVASAGAPGRITVIRIIGRKFAGNAFSGDGARLYGGRWNIIGTSMVYTAGSISLAILEWRAHLAQWPAPAVSVIEVGLDESLIWIPSRLPSNWNRVPAPAAAAEFGDEWIKSGRSVAMRIPSAVVPQEWNYLLNPAHPHFSKLAIGKPRAIKPDARLGPLAGR